MQIETLDARNFTEAEARSIGELLAVVWPNPEKPVAYRTQQMLEMGEGYDGRDDQAPRSYVVREEGRVIAHSAIIPRTIGTSSGEITIAGLARVCCDPAHRGRGLGELVVRAAFDPVDSGAFAFSLFQTSNEVCPFYEKLGASVVKNTIVNSLSQDLHESPFWDRVVMRYPKTGEWPIGEIDLRGPGY